MSRQDFESSLILVKDIMTKALISVPGETTVFQVAKMMEQGGIGAVLVKNNDRDGGGVPCPFIPQYHIKLEQDGHKPTASKK